MKPAGQISSVELERLSSFLISGKSLYLEGYDFAQDHYQLDFFNMLGCKFISDGNLNSNILSLQGSSSSFVHDFSFDYGHTPSARTRNDVIEAVDGQLMFFSQDSSGYGVIYHNGIYRVITAAFMFGALIDGEGLNNKAELMKRYLQFFEGSLSVEDFDADNDKPLDFSLKQNYPNPFRQTTIINFSFAEKNNPIALSVYNLLGQEVKKFTVINGNYAVNWDGTDFNGLPLPSGTYIYQLKTADKILSRKMNLVR